MKSLINSGLMVAMVALLSLSRPASAFQLKIHEVDIVHKAVAEIPVANTLNSPIVVRITPPRMECKYSPVVSNFFQESGK